MSSESAVASVPMSAVEFPWSAVSDRLSCVRDDDVRGDALMIAYRRWAARVARGKACSLPTLCWRAVQDARRRAKRRAAACDVCSAAVEYAAARQDRPMGDASGLLNRLSGRARDVAQLLADGLAPAEIADRLNVSRPRVSQLIGQIAESL